MCLNKSTKQSPSDSTCNYEEKYIHNIFIIFSQQIINSKFSITCCVGME